MEKEKSSIDVNDTHFDFSPETMPPNTKALFLEKLIDKYKEKIKKATPHTDEMRTLVNQLINLRLKHLEMQDTCGEVEEEGSKYVMGHVFLKASWTEKKAYCEVCCGLIISVFHTSFKCSFCGYCCHDYCLNQTKRICSFLKVQENPKYIMAICPEKGLCKQDYKCAECKREIGFAPGKKEARLCHYSGLYYCNHCHWNDSTPLPAKVIANWNFDSYKVARPSKCFLRLMSHKAVINLEQLNPFLFKHSEELSKIKMLREEVMLMKAYLSDCNTARKERILSLQLGTRSHFIDTSSLYSMQDLLDTHAGNLLTQLQASHKALLFHIKSSCEVCRSKGAICCICHSHQPVHSFDSIRCQRCSASMHVLCYNTSGQNCPKCSSAKQNLQ